MKLEDYSKYYIQGSDHYLIPKDIFVELFNEMINWKKDTKKIKKQLNYIRSGEYYNQLRFENEMLQQVVDTNGVPSEVYDYIECLHMNTELLEENEKLKKKLNEAIHKATEFESETYELKKKLEEQDYTVIPNCDIKPLIDKYKNQQQEFIKYLEDEKFFYEINTQGYSMNLIENVLANYKSIIGEK